MHICHINLARGFRGGERQTLLLIEGLAQKGVEQTLICRRGHLLAKKATKIENLHVVTIDKPFLLHSLLATKCDLMHAHEGHGCRFAFYSYLFRKKPYLITRRIPNKPGNSLPTKLMYKKSAKIVSLSHSIKQNLLAYNPELNIEVIPSMRSDLQYDKENVTHLREKYAGKIIIGHIGALVNHHKGQQLLIEAAKMLQAQHKNFQFLFLGSGRDESWLKEQAKELSNVEFVGFLDNVGDYLSIFDLFVFPSLEEGFGSILLDAMQFKVPIIASNIGGIPEFMKHKENGFLVEPGSAQSLVDAILYLLDNKEFTSRLIANSSIAIENYSKEIISDCYLSVYRHILFPRQVYPVVN